MTAVTCLAGLNPAGYRPHSLHTSERNWPETNCYVDLWIELLHALGHQPEAALGFTVTQDFEGDQFTFFKFPAEDLAKLYGLRVQELAIYDRVELHSLEQLQRGRLVLVEVDSFYLPDTRGTSYGATHGKTTVAINHLDPEQRELHYFHNAGYFKLEGSDYDGIFRAELGDAAAALFPYVEFVKRATPESRDTSLNTARQLLRHHLAARPKHNPLRAFQQAFPAQAEQLGQRPMEFFHLYAFNTLRQIGANFELLSSHLNWLTQQGEGGLDPAATAALDIATGAKTLQFQLARAVARKRFDKLDEVLTTLAAAYDKVFEVLTTRYA
jgi:Domain of unknown function (DUF1839)